MIENNAPWSSLKSAHGSSEKVPELLAAIWSESSDIQDDAISLLFEIIWHQGTVFEASVPALDYLLKSLKQVPVPKCESEIAMLIACIGTGKSAQATLRNSRIKDKAGEISHDPALDGQGEIETTIRERIIGDLDVIIKYLGDQNPEVRGEVADLLGQIP